MYNHLFDPDLQHLYIKNVLSVDVKWMVRVMEIRWMSSDVNRPNGVDERRKRRW